MKTIAELVAEEDIKPLWLCEPYAVARGITFLHGKTSIGKSPLTWELARCVSQGIPFFGWPTTRSRVLYLEADGAEPLVRKRLKFLPEPLGKWMYQDLAGRSLDLLRQDNSIWADLYKCQREWIPDLVIWNTLRQFYQGGNIDSEIVTRVYSAMYKAFPQAGHFVVAHDRKTSTQADAHKVEDEDFAGSAAWRDLATVGLHLVRTRVEVGKGSHLILKQTKSQVSEPVEPVSLLLQPDGTQWTTRHDQDERIHETWGQAPTKGDKATWVASTLGISRSSVSRARERLRTSQSVTAP